MKRQVPLGIILTAMTAASLCLGTPLFAQASDDAYFGGSGISDSGDDIFGSSGTSDPDDDLFGGSGTSDSDDLFFADDGIVELAPAPSDSKSSDLAHGILFQSGSVKIGGSFDTSLTTCTTLYNAETNKKFWENLRDTGLFPKANASLTIDARPTQTLRMYTKFGVNYPYSTSISSAAILSAFSSYSSNSTVTIPVTNYFTVKELFTDFSIADRAFFRFGLHTVSWGTGFFFSPVSDMINTSSINPEDTDAQVNGSLNLRTQITFPGTQNCLWLYLIPDSKLNTISSSNYADTPLSTYLDTAQYPYDLRRTAIAAKGEFVTGGWELGGGLFFRYQNAPKAMLTASGTIINGKVGVFGEAVYRYGSNTQWTDQPDSWKDKTHIFQGTIGLNYIWKTPQITFAVQYYFDGNKDDDEYATYGNNVAATVIFGRIFGTTDCTATLLGIFYTGKKAVTSPTELASLYTNGKNINPYAGIISAMFKYSPISMLSLSAGPYVTWLDFSNKPQVALRIQASLGGGKF